MNGFMKKALAGFIVSGAMVTAVAQDASMAGMASMEVSTKLTQEVMAEIPADKMADTDFMMGKIIEKMEANIDQLKEASKKDCIAVYGEAKADACSCAADKTDYKAGFDLMKKQAADPTTSLEEEAKALAEKSEKVTLDCGFTQEELEQGRAKLMEMMQGQGA